MATSIVSPDAFEAPSALPQTNRNGWASKEDWIKHQTLIGQLYRQQPLAEVMAFMTKEHNFRATEKMYKTRIKQWGLDKKHKENEMRAVVRKNKELGSQGKSGNFRVRGRPIDFKDVVSYFKRKNVRLEDVIAQRTGSKTPEAVDYFITVPSPITTPESIAIPERILISIRDYLRGSFENRTWNMPISLLDCQMIKPRGRADSDYLFNCCQTACQLFARNHFQEAGQILIAATSRIRAIILAEHPRTLQYIFRITRLLFQEKRYEIPLAILRQYSALAEIVMGKTHPIGCICGWLASITPLQWGTVIARCDGSLADHFESLAGPFNVTAVYSRLGHITSGVDTEHNMNQGLILLKDLLHKCETVLGPRDVRSGEVRLRLAWYYTELLDYAEAKRVVRDLITFEQHVVGREIDVYFYTECLHIVAVSEHAMGDIRWAEVHLREAIESRIYKYGLYDNKARRLLVDLEEWLVEQGHFDSAAEVHERWRQSLVDCTDYV